MKIIELNNMKYKTWKYKNHSSLFFIIDFILAKSFFLKLNKIFDIIMLKEEENLL